MNPIHGFNKLPNQSHYSEVDYNQFDLFYNRFYFTKFFFFLVSKRKKTAMINYFINTNYDTRFIDSKNKISHKLASETILDRPTNGTPRDMPKQCY